LLLAEIGVENRDELLDRMGYGEEDDYDPADDIIDQRTQAAPQSITGQDASTADNAGINDSKLKKTAEAITRLIEATRRRARKMVA
jgi:hypothetical protein